VEAEAGRREYGGAAMPGQGAKRLFQPGHVRRWIPKVNPKRLPQIQETAPRNGLLLSNRLDPGGHERV
jgi:hypothetical protein